MNKLLIVCGPTATGKTDLGIYLAKKFDGEIVSADSRHVYKGLDIITGKDLPKSDIPIWLVDIVTPDYPFNVGEYAVLAHKIINNIWSRKKLPVIVGGTGFYIKSITDKIETVIIPPNKLLRRDIEKYTKEKLQQELIKTDYQRWKKMNVSDRENPRRLIRAVEIALYYQNNKNNLTRLLNPLPIDSKLMIGLTNPLQFLFKKIDERVENRIKKGAVKEVKELLGKNYSRFLPALSSTGFKPLSEFIQGRESLADAVKSWKFQEHEYARRQMTWFRKDERIRWFGISEKRYINKIEDKVREWYTSGTHAFQNRNFL